ncbi:MAG: DsbA family protein, partial [Actinobacteria bacterium]|nr:DsbA family protein [Actinomycetota bacterium]
MVPESELTSNAQESEPKIAPRILLFYDYACPFCYVDQFRFDRLVSERDVDIVLVPFELRPDMPDEGHNVSELEAAGMDHGHIEEHLRDLSLREGFPLTIPP